MKVLAHIGHHKTGITSIQSRLAKNRDALLEKERFYVLTGVGSRKNWSFGRRAAGLDINERLTAARERLTETLLRGVANITIFERMKGSG